jgi:hypothetical protein
MTELDARYHTIGPLESSVGGDMSGRAGHPAEGCCERILKSLAACFGGSDQPESSRGSREDTTRCGPSSGRRKRSTERRKSLPRFLVDRRLEHYTYEAPAPTTVSPQQQRVPQAACYEVDAADRGPLLPKVRPSTRWRAASPELPVLTPKVSPRAHEQTSTRYCGRVRYCCDRRSSLLPPAHRRRSPQRCCHGQGTAGTTHPHLQPRLLPRWLLVEC